MYVFVPVTKFESLNDSVGKVLDGSGKMEISLMSVSMYCKLNWVRMGARCYSFIYQLISNSKLLGDKQNYFHFTDEETETRQFFLQTLALRALTSQNAISLL